MENNGFLDVLESNGISHIITIRNRAKQFLDQVSSGIELEGFRNNGHFIWKVANQWILLGVVDHIIGENLKLVASRIRRGIAEMIRALENGYDFSPREVFYLFLTSLALSDRSSAQFVAALPDCIHMNRGIITNQTFTAFAIYRGEEKLASRFLEVLYGLSFEEPLFSEIGENYWSVKNIYWILDSLLNRDCSKFNEQLNEGVQYRSQYLKKKALEDPINLVDLPALGLCRLAQERNLAIGVNHICLPLGILTVPWS